MAILEFFLNLFVGTAILLSLSQPLYAAILKHETTQLKLHEHTYADFCQTMNAKNATLISDVGMGEIECFNQKFKITDFCLQKDPQAKHITRGYPLDKEKKVLCEEGKAVMVSVSCDERDLHFCLDPKKGCEQLQKIYAVRFEVVHYSMLDKNLNCYFAKPLGDTLDEI
jgi:hypothetical protein